MALPEPPPPPELMEELVEEILLRFPPEEPTSLVQAALVCKLWCRLVCGAAFRRRFRLFHRGAAPLLGLLYNDHHKVKQVSVVNFAPTTSFHHVHATDGRYGWWIMDARHGRVLLSRVFDKHVNLCIWDPITDKQRDLPEPPFDMLDGRSAAVACATSATGDCDHVDCCSGPFLVVVVSMHENNNMSGIYLSVYSSEAGAWSKVTIRERPTIDSDELSMFNNVHGVLVRGALYFMVHFNDEIVKYNLATQEVSMIPLPFKVHHWKKDIVLMTDDDGGSGLGFVATKGYKLELWSGVAGADKDAGFFLSRIIDLEKVLPFCTLKWKMPQVDGFADAGANRVLFIRTVDGLYGIEINSSRVSKIANSCGDGEVIPYISFCTPTSRLQVQEYKSTTLS